MANEGLNHNEYIMDHTSKIENLISWRDIAEKRISALEENHQRLFDSIDKKFTRLYYFLITTFGLVLLHLLYIVFDKVLK